MLPAAIVALAILASAGPALSAPFSPLDSGALEAAVGCFPLPNGDGFTGHTVSSSAPISPVMRSPALQALIDQPKKAQITQLATRDDTDSEALSFSKIKTIVKIGLNILGNLSPISPSPSTSPLPPPPPAPVAASAPSTSAAVQQREVLELLARASNDKSDAAILTDAVKGLVSIMLYQYLRRDEGSGNYALQLPTDVSKRVFRLIQPDFTSSSTSAPAPIRTSMPIIHPLISGLVPHMAQGSESTAHNNDAVQARELLEFLARANDSDDESDASILSTIKSVLKDAKTLGKISKVTSVVSDGATVLSAVTAPNQQQAAPPAPAPAPQPSVVQQRDEHPGSLFIVHNGFHSQNFRPASTFPGTQIPNPHSDAVFTRESKKLFVRSDDDDESGASLISSVFNDVDKLTKISKVTSIVSDVASAFHALTSGSQQQASPPPPPPPPPPATPQPSIVQQRELNLGRLLSGVNANDAIGIISKVEARHIGGSLLDSRELLQVFARADPDESGAIISGFFRKVFKKIAGILHRELEEELARRTE